MDEMERMGAAQETQSLTAEPPSDSPGPSDEEGLPEYALDEDGQLVTPRMEALSAEGDNKCLSEPEDPPEQPEQQQQAPYTPTEMEELGLERLDPSRIPPELHPFYRSMLRDYTRKTQIVAEQRRAIEEAGRQQREAQQRRPPTMAEAYAMLDQEALRRTTEMLGIAPDEYDDLNRVHRGAYDDARRQLMAQFEEGQRQQREQQQIEQHVRHVWNEGVAAVAGEIHIQEILNWAPEWFDGLTSKEVRTGREELSQALRAGDSATVTKYVEKLRAAWYAKHRPQPAAPKRTVPPKTVPASGAATPFSGVDLREFGNMSPDEQADALRRLGLTGNR